MRMRSQSSLIPQHDYNSFSALRGETLSKIDIPTHEFDRNNFEQPIYGDDSDYADDDDLGTGAAFH